MIDRELILKHGGHIIKLEKGHFLFNEGDTPSHYYQVISGAVKMSNFSADGKEFVQGIFLKNESFGEPPLFGDFPYPSSAIAIKTTSLYRLSKMNFMELLKNNFIVHLNFTKTLSQRMLYKAMILREISSYEPEHRILTLIDYLKGKAGNQVMLYEVPFTRQQVADMTGLRVETVIRAMKKLEEKGEIQIINRKAFR